MRTCIWCSEPLPEPSHKGHRRQQFCKRPKNCRQQHYLWHKQMKHDADMLAEPYWRIVYGVLVEQYKQVELLLQERLNDLAEERKRTDKLEEQVQYYQGKIEALQADYAARLKALDLSDQDIEAFHTYWKKQMEPFNSETV